MFKVNDYIVYGLTGVCRITDIAKDEINNNETQYYVFTPLDNDNLTIKVPVDNQNVLMRPIITKEDILPLIASVSEMESIYLNDDRQRNVKLKTALKSGDYGELLKIIKTLHLEREARDMVGKKLSKTDEEIMNTAEKQLNQEFAIALNIPPDEVLPYILGHIPKQSNNNV